MLNIEITYKDEKTLNMFNLLRKYYPDALAIIKNGDISPIARELNLPLNGDAKISTESNIKKDTNIINVNISHISNDFIVKNTKLCYQFSINMEHQRKASINCMDKFVPVIIDVNKSNTAFTEQIHILFTKTENIIYQIIKTTTKKNDYAIFCYSLKPHNDFENFITSLSNLKNKDQITRYYMSQLLLVLVINDTYVIKISFSNKPTITKNVIVHKYNEFPLLNIKKGFIGYNKSLLVKEWNNLYTAWYKNYQTTNGCNWNDPIIVQANLWTNEKSNEKPNEAPIERKKREKDFLGLDSEKYKPNPKKKKKNNIKPNTKSIQSDQSNIKTVKNISCSYRKYSPIVPNPDYGMKKNNVPCSYRNYYPIVPNSDCRTEKNNVSCSYRNYSPLVPNPDYGTEKQCLQEDTVIQVENLNFLAENSELIQKLDLNLTFEAQVSFKKE